MAARLGFKVPASSPAKVSAAYLILSPPSPPGPVYDLFTLEFGHRRSGVLMAEASTPAPEAYGRAVM